MRTSQMGANDGIKLVLVLLLLGCIIGAIVYFVNTSNTGKTTTPAAPTPAPDTPAAATPGATTPAADTSSTNVTRTKWYEFDQLADYSSDNIFNTWTDEVNWGFTTAASCVRRCNDTEGCDQVGWSPWQDNEGKRNKGYCYMRKAVKWPLDPWKNKDGVAAAESQRSYIKADKVPDAYKDKGNLVEF